MNHDDFKNKDGIEEAVKIKARHAADQIVAMTSEGYEIIFKDILKDGASYGIISQQVNWNKVPVSYVEIQILTAGYIRYAANVLPENLYKIFSQELIQKLAKAREEETKGIFSTENYKGLATNRFLWYDKENKGKEIKYYTIPSGETYKKICKDLFGVYNEKLDRLFNLSFLAPMIFNDDPILDFKDLLAMHHDNLAGKENLTATNNSPLEKNITF